jgi:hypothetical protein
MDHQRIKQGRSVARQVLLEALSEAVLDLHASGKTVSGVVKRTGIGKKRTSAWVGLTESPERDRMEPNLRPPTFHPGYLTNSIPI